MSKHSIIIRIFCIVAVVVGGLISISCSPATGSPSTGPSITSLVAEHTAIYSVGNTRVTCSALSKDGGALTYQWVSDGGTITGSGQVVTWEAPKTYGDFHIMCTVFDSSGNRASQTVTVTVIVRDPSNPGCCR